MVHRLGKDDGQGRYTGRVRMMGKDGTQASLVEKKIKDDTHSRATLGCKEGRKGKKGRQRNTLYINKGTWMHNCAS
eukprot:1161214-Pelagomonas_calceolata.AAC.6